MANSADRNLELAQYNGETKRWNFYKYFKVHMEQHQIVTDLMTHGYIGIYLKSKMRKLLLGIKTDALNSVKTQFLAYPTLRSDFTLCVWFIQIFHLTVCFCFFKRFPTHLWI